ncbi:hypothetical protein Pogu_2121 [Pyrobaculum oguniense TE7]|uniref:Uncharacterized protein n=1 Tax=Pyrobaculum oguniense (strain DSM 13380 / JCM 10595 / TE7) TaxID=698757 RepID=H6QCV2_PYROT|nr:hypothetical protein Pogu_2121 [Pyrobaculum oguniense TE7]
MKLAVFVLKSGLKQFGQFRRGYEFAYLDSQRLIPERVLQKKDEYEEVVIVDSTAASGITLLKAKARLEGMGFRNVKLAAHPATKHAKALVDIPLPRQEPVGGSVFVSGLPGAGKSAFAYGLAQALGAHYVRWGKEVSARFSVGKYGEELARLEAENPFAASERLILDGVFDTEKEFIVVDGAKSLWQVVHVSYATLRPAVPLFVEVPQEVRELIVSVRDMPDDPYDADRKALFSGQLEELREASVVVRLDAKRLDGAAERVFRSLGVDSTIRGYFNPFITKEVLLESWFRAWKKAGNVHSPLVDKWISSLGVKMHRGYVERLRRKGVVVGGDAAEVITLAATAARIIDDILDEHTVRLYSEEGVVEEAWWVRRGIYLAVVDSIALMVKARGAARRLGAEAALVKTFERMVEAVKAELELEVARREPALKDWLKAAEREAAFREFAYGLAGVSPELGYVEGVAAQAKDDLYGATKGGREDTDSRLNRPLFQRVCRRPEEALDGLKKAKSREEVLSALQLCAPR